MTMHMQQGSSYPQEASAIRVRSAVRGGQSSSSKLPWRLSPTLSRAQAPSLFTVQSFLHQSSSLSVDRRYMGSSRLRREFKKALNCKICIPFSGLNSAATLEWEPALDNLLLVLSIALAYIAGIVTPSSRASPFFAQKGRSSPRLEISEEMSKVQGAANEANPSSEEDFWNLARLKLLSSVDVGDDKTDDIQVEKTCQGLQLSLQALAKGPRLRLLLITLEQLNKEVWNFQQNESFLRLDWSRFSTQKLCDIVIPICRLWMCGEYMRSLKNGRFMKEGCILSESIDNNLVTEWNLLFDSYSQDYSGYKSMKSSLLATGKAEFYADFLYFLCSGSVRQNSFCGTETLRSDRGLVLEDLIIYIADKAAALYLDIISCGSSICNSQWFDIMSKSIPSTRLLEKFRNEVALNGWLNDNFQSVTAMFEDRFDLWILKSGNKDSDNGSQPLKLQVKDHRQRDKSMVHSSVVIEHYKLFARRGRELRALTGWRYYFSLYLEFSDICGPLLRTIATKLGEGISFLLVILIGRSLGLIYRGIRQSLQWSSS